MDHKKPGFWKHARASVRGFNLIEVLLALAIFTIGFVTVGALLPVAVSEQRWAMDDAMAQQLARTARDMMRGQKLHISTTPGTFGPPTSPDFRPALTDATYYSKFTGANSVLTTLQPLWHNIIPVPNPFLTYYYSARDCTSPRPSMEWATMPWPSGVKDNPSEAWRFYWTALARRTKPNSMATTDWQVCVFVMRRDSNDSPDPVPLQMANLSVAGSRFNFTVDKNLINLPLPTSDAVLRISAGDLIVDEIGNVYRVVAADPPPSLGGNGNWIEVAGQIPPQINNANTSVWYCPPQIANKPSSTLSIQVLTDAVEP